MNKPQLSPILFETLSSIEINGNPLTLALFETAKRAILELGDHEHSGDWDPYLSITLNDGTEIDTATGYPEITFGDFDDSEQDTFLKHYTEITSIGFEIENEDEEIFTQYINIQDIKSISLER